VCFVLKKVENGGVFFVKSGLFLNAVFFILHFTYLGVRTHPTHTPTYGPVEPMTVTENMLVHLTFFDRLVLQ